MNRSFLVLVSCIWLAGCDNTRRLAVDSGATPDAGIDASTEPTIDASAVDAPAVDGDPTDPTCETNDDCSADAFCFFFGGCQSTGAKMARCEKRPSACDGEDAPVCGCNGVTYSNECFAHAAGINVATKDKCSGTCGTAMYLPACPEGTFCDFASCGAATGNCVEIPLEGKCYAIDGLPECGCDGKDYDNSCWRQAAGVALDHVGFCVEGGAVTVTTDKASYASGETTKITLTNGLTESIFLGGCGVFLLERAEKNGTWVNKGPTVICVWEGIPKEVKAKTTVLSDEIVKAGTWRILLPYGLGCTPGKAPSAAGCASMEQVHSAPFDVAPSASECTKLEDNYAASMTAAKECDELINTPQCTHLVIDALQGCCSTYVNSTAKLEAIEAEWKYSNCQTLSPPTPCPPCPDPINAICDSNLCYDQDV